MTKHTEQELKEQISNLEEVLSQTNSFFTSKVLIDEKKMKVQKYIIIAITIILTLSIFGNIYCVHEMSKFQLVEDTTETTETYEIKQRVDGENSQINNNNVQGNQYNDNAIHNENSKDSD